MRYLIVIISMFFASNSFAAEDVPKDQGQKLEIGPGGVEGATEQIELTLEGPADDPFNIPDSVKQYQNERKVAEARRKYCRQYNKSYISYYDDIYYVESCKRKQISGPSDQYLLTKNRTKIHFVDADVIAIIPEGEPLLLNKKKKLRTCKDLNGKYVTFSDVDVYFVENCKLKIFPDWDTYIKHRRNRGGGTGEILGLEWEEFSKFFEYDAYGELKPFPPMKSVIDEEYAKSLDVEPEVDIIPVDEACRGLNGRWVSFYSRMYRIESCRKREVDPEKFWSKNKGKGKQLNVKELSPEQWISLPNGKPWTL